MHAFGCRLGWAFSVSVVMVPIITCKILLYVMPESVLKCCGSTDLGKDEVATHSRNVTITCA